MRALALLAVFAAAGCGSDEEPAAPRPARTATPAETTPAPGARPDMQPIAGGVGWTAEEPFIPERPANDMRDAQYGVAGHPGTELTVSHFDPDVGGGGDVDENLRRWIGQFEPSSRSQPAIERRTVNDLRVTTIDMIGTFIGRRGMGPAGPPRPDTRLLGAIVEGPRGLVFFKLLGARDGVREAEDAFEALVASIHPEG